jgi:hypothetical protein
MFGDHAPDPFVGFDAQAKLPKTKLFVFAAEKPKFSNSSHLSVWILAVPSRQRQDIGGFIGKKPFQSNHCRSEGTLRRSLRDRLRG